MTESEDYDWAQAGLDLQQGVTQSMSFDARALVKRQLAWDMFPHAAVPGILAGLGMTPASPEVLELEHADAHHRMDPLLEIQHCLWPVVELTAEIVNGAMLEDHDADHLQVLDEHGIRDIIRASVVGVLSHLLDEKVLVVNDEPKKETGCSHE